MGETINVNICNHAYLRLRDERMKSFWHITVALSVFGSVSLFHFNIWLLLLQYLFIPFHFHYDYIIQIFLSILLMWTVMLFRSIATPSSIKYDAKHIANQHTVTFEYVKKSWKILWISVMVRNSLTVLLTAAFNMPTIFFLPCKQFLSFEAFWVAWTHHIAMNISKVLRLLFNKHCY